MKTAADPSILRLREGYHAMRADGSATFRRHCGPFEGQPWKTVEKMEMRDGVDGSQLRVYEIEGDIEVCIIDADGQSSTYA